MSRCSSRPKEVVIIIDDTEEVDIIDSRPSKILKTTRAVASETLVLTLPTPEQTPTSTRFWTLTDASASRPHLSPVSSALELATRGRQNLLSQNWSFSASNPPTTPTSSPRSSSATLESSPSSITISRQQSLNTKDIVSVLDLTSFRTTKVKPMSIRPQILQPVNSVVEIPDDEDIESVVCNTPDLSSANVIYDLTNDDDTFFNGQVIYELNNSQPDVEIYQIDDDNLEPEPEPNQHNKIQGSSRVPPRRNPPVTYPLRVLRDVLHHDTTLSSGMTVEVIEANMVVEDAYFLNIVKIVSNELTGEVILSGHRLQRTRDGNGILEKKLNEIYLCHEVDLDDPRDVDEQSVVEVPLADVVRTRSLRFTNRQFPRARHIGNAFRNVDKPQLYAEGGLTLRWTYTCFYLTGTHRHNNKYGERVLDRVRSNESSTQYGVSDASLRERWRGDTITGGAFRPSASSGSSGRGNRKDLPFLRTSKRTHQETEERVEITRRPINVIDLSNGTPSHRKSSTLPRVLSLPLNLNAGEFMNSSMQRQRVRVPGQKYTFGDAFCGAGGTTRGAEMAGLKVLWGFDFDETACTTWRQNFDADCYQMEAFRFADIFKNTDAAKVDILHLSPPCQYFAPCHTRAGPNDEANSAALFAVQEIITIAKPRIVTLEQTLGLGRQRQHQGYLNSLIQMFTKAGFSVRWQIVFLAPLGLPARRERLIVIASCPGEILPQMPRPTHSENGAGGLKPFETVNATIARLHPSTNLDPDIKYFNEAQLQHPKVRPYDGNKILPKAITCSGGDYNYHPSGKRGFTIREFAALQGFPPVHTFSGMSGHGLRLKGSTIVRKQIGNAVPPVVARTLFESIVKDLQRVDGIESDHILID